MDRKVRPAAQPYSTIMDILLFSKIKQMPAFPTTSRTVSAGNPRLLQSFEKMRTVLYQKRATMDKTATQVASHEASIQLREIPEKHTFM